MLFFFLGIIAVILRSDLEIPQSISRFLSIYLLMAIGIKGGIELGKSQLGTEILITIILAVFISSIVPVYTFFILRKKFNSYNSAAIAATYGSISVVTFVSAVAFAKEINLSYGGHMIAVMAIMETPALIVRLFLLKNSFSENNNSNVSLVKLIHESLVNSSVFLILGSLFVGAIASHTSINEIIPFTKDMFKGVLALFMLDMGIIAAKRLNSLRKGGMF